MPIRSLVALPFKCVGVEDRDREPWLVRELVGVEALVRESWLDREPVLDRGVRFPDRRLLGLAAAEWFELLRSDRDMLPSEAKEAKESREPCPSKMFLSELRKTFATSVRIGDSSISCLGASCWCCDVDLVRLDLFFLRLDFFVDFEAAVRASRSKRLLASVLSKTTRKASFKSSRFCFSIVLCWKIKSSICDSTRNCSKEFCIGLCSFLPDLFLRRSLGRSFSKEDFTNESKGSSLSRWKLSVLDMERVDGTDRLVWSKKEVPILPANLISLVGFRIEAFLFATQCIGSSSDSLIRHPRCFQKAETVNDLQ